MIQAPFSQVCSTLGEPSPPDRDQLQIFPHSHSFGGGSAPGCSCQTHLHCYRATKDLERLLGKIICSGVQVSFLIYTTCGEGCPLLLLTGCAVSDFRQGFGLLFNPALGSGSLVTAKCPHRAPRTGRGHLPSSGTCQGHIRAPRRVGSPHLFA